MVPGSRTVGWGAVLVVMALACSKTKKTPVARGAGIFQRTCAGCHGITGKGSNRLGLNPPPRDLTQPELHAQYSVEQMVSVVRVGKGQMPAFGGLMSDSDIRDVVAFVRTLAQAKSPEGT